MKYYTTLKRIRAFDPCGYGLEDLLEHIGEDYPVTKEIYFEDVLNTGVNINNVLWGFQTATRTQRGDLKKIERLWACDCAERVLHLFEKMYPEDKRPRDAIEASRKFAHGEINDIARAAAGDAERSWQKERLIHYLNGYVVI